MKTHNGHYSMPYTYTNRDKIKLIVHPSVRVKLFLPYIQTASRILELGCGKGTLARQIQKHTKAEVFGVDISGSGINIANKSGITAKVADLNKKLPFPDNYFDAVVSDQLIEHIYKTDHLVGEIYRILRPGGIAITITPNLAYWLNRILFVLGIYPIFLETGEASKLYGMKCIKKYITDTGIQGHIHVFNLAALVDIFKAHAFRILIEKSSPFSWQIPKIFKILYNALDIFFAQFPSLGRDIMVVAQKPDTLT